MQLKKEGNRTFFMILKPTPEMPEQDQ